MHYNTSGCDCGTADIIFHSIMSQYDTSIHGIGFGVDNTSVNVGVHKSIMTPIKALVISWDVLVILHVHNIACKGSNALCNGSG